MRDATQMDDLAHAWELFLIFHQRTWNKCQANYKGRDFWGPLLPKYSAIRKNDGVLIYAHQARHVDEHGIEPITQVNVGSTKVTGGTLTGGSSICGGSHYVLAPGSTASVEVTPSKVAANSVTNCGRTYDPPVLDGNQNPSVLCIAEHAILFLEALFAEIDAAGGD